MATWEQLLALGVKPEDAWSQMYGSQLPNDQLGAVVQPPIQPVNQGMSPEMAKRVLNAVNPKKAVQEDVRTRPSTIEELTLAQEAGIGDQEAAVRAAQAIPEQLDLSPIMALTDSLYGTKLQSGYNKPMSMADRKALETKLRSVAQADREGLIKNMLAQSNDKRMLDMLRLQGTQNRFDIKRAEVTDKQTDEINQFDSAAQEAAGLMQDLKPGYTGFIEQGKGLPLIKQFADQDAVTFQSRIGRLTDQYRRLVTGAAAADQELKRIESRLPQINDPPELFRKKSEDFIKQLNRAKARYIGNLGKKGKDVSNFSPVAAEIPNGSKPKQVDQADWDNATAEEKAALINHFGQ